jgi:hypothetical protein
MKKLFILLAVLGLFTACGGGPKFKVNDVVLADWYQGNWHIGKLTEACTDSGDDKGNKGWRISFNDNFYNSSNAKQPVCYTEDRLILNVAPSAKAIKAEDVILAEWMEDAFYSAKIQKIDGEKYSVKFVSDGWESQLTLDKLRVLPPQAIIPAPKPVVAPAVVPVAPKTK